MNSLVKRGFGVYRIFLKDKLAMSVMMLVSGVMMFVAALNGKGNDTVTMPLGITLAGAAFTFWSFYRIGYEKSQLDTAETEAERQIGRAAITMQIVETAVYLAVAAVGVFLLINHDFMNMMLNLMAGIFTTINGVTGVVTVAKTREHKDFRWWIKVVLSAVEIIMGPYFIFQANEVNIGWLTAMGVLTSVAGVLEVISALTPESIRSTAKDGQDIIRILKEK